MQSTSEYLGDLDLANEWRLTRRWARVWIVESSSVWGDIRSVVEMECVQNLETRIFRQRGWNLGVSPNKEPLSDTDANKENIPPTPEPFNFEQILIALYDKEFTDPMAYHLHVQQKFPNLANDTNLRMFDSAYCCHCLLSKQEEALNTMKVALNDMQKSLDTMISEA